MESVDEELRLAKEHYARMMEGEIVALAGQAYDLTEIGREALQAVISERGLDVQLQTVRAPALSPKPCEPSDIDDSALVNWGWARDAEELKQIKEQLTTLETACFIGPDKVLEPEDYKGSFADGVNVKVRSVDWQLALRRLAQLQKAKEEEPQQEETEAAEEEEEEQDFAVLCPQCNSSEIVFDGRDWKDPTDAPPTAKFNWSCSDCGYQWKDDGIEQELPAGQADKTGENIFRKNPFAGHWTYRSFRSDPEPVGDVSEDPGQASVCRG